MAIPSRSDKTMVVIAPARRFQSLDSTHARAVAAEHVAPRLPFRCCTSAAALPTPSTRTLRVRRSALATCLCARYKPNRSGSSRPATATLPRSAVVRLPLDGAPPSMLKTSGAPIDQMSFLEDDSGHLNVLLRSLSRGEGMWNAERGAGELALLRVPLASFGGGAESAPRSAYRPLPSLPGGTLQNRFVGDWLLYGTLAGGAGEHAVALRFAARGEAQTLTLGHGVERIEALGRDAVLVGNAGRDLHFTSLRLSSDNDAQVVDTHVRPNAAQGETRTHGFFYRAAARDDGVIGLPVISADGGRRGIRGESAAVLFLRNRALGLKPVGELKSSLATHTVATINARPVASTGTAMRGRSFLATASSRCWATNSSKGAWPGAVGPVNGSKSCGA